jgi:hypothetical protein
VLAKAAWRLLKAGGLSTNLLKLGRRIGRQAS